MNIPKTMQAVVIEAPNEYGLQEVPTPEHQAGEVLVRIKAVAICGSDPKIFSGKMLGFWPPAYPFIAGHEWAGEIVACGADVKNFQVGDRVAGEAHKGCGFCENCQRGAYNLCLHYSRNDLGHRHYGFTSPGAYAQYNVYSPMSIAKIPTTMAYEEASLCDTAGTALHALELSRLTAGGNVVVFGPGPIGILTQMLAKTCGAEQVIMVGRGQRLDMAARMGANHCINFERQDVVQAILNLTEGMGADEIFECSGAEVSIVRAIKSARRGGKIVLVGVPSTPEVDHLPMREVMLNQLQILGSRANPNVSARILRLMASGRIDVKSLITHTFPLQQIHQAMETFLQRKDGAMKVIVKP